MGTATATKTRRRGGHNKRWTITELKLAKGRLPIREVAKRTGRTEQAVAQKRTELNAAGVRKSRRGKGQPKPNGVFAGVETYDHNGTVQNAVLQELRDELDTVTDDMDAVSESIDHLEDDLAKLVARRRELEGKISDIQAGKVNVEVRFVQ